ncbi:hypothetical protein BGZ63DRAFT_425982 [Mariannaea sp. PMI_226]|nr:hypothetical protein BGZ63DRAFT_425982 [Mariannaea sp. PMI_226]
MDPIQHIDTLLSMINGAQVETVRHEVVVLVEDLNRKRRDAATAAEQAGMQKKALDEQIQKYEAAIERLDLEKVNAEVQNLTSKASQCAAFLPAGLGSLKKVASEFQRALLDSAEGIKLSAEESASSIRAQVDALPKQADLDSAMRSQADATTASVRAEVEAAGAALHEKFRAVSAAILDKAEAASAVLESQVETTMVLCDQVHAASEGLGELSEMIATMSSGLMELRTSHETGQAEHKAVLQQVLDAQAQVTVEVDKQVKALQPTSRSVEAVKSQVNAIRLQLATVESLAGTRASSGRVGALASQVEEVQAQLATVSAQMRSVASNESVQAVSSQIEEGLATTGRSLEVQFSDLVTRARAAIVQDVAAQMEPTLQSAVRSIQRDAFQEAASVINRGLAHRRLDQIRTLEGQLRESQAENVRLQQQQATEEAGHNEQVGELQRANDRLQSRVVDLEFQLDEVVQSFEGPGNETTPMPTPQTQPSARKRARAESGSDSESGSGSGSHVEASLAGVGNVSRAYLELADLANGLFVTGEDAVALALAAAPTLLKSEGRSKLTEFLGCGDKASDWHCLQDVCEDGELCAAAYASEHSDRCVFVRLTDEGQLELAKTVNSD